MKGKTLPLKNDNVLLRGTRLRNTHWAFGSKIIESKMFLSISFSVVCYAGPDTKLMKNSGKATFKRTKIDHLLNRIILGVRIYKHLNIFFKLNSIFHLDLFLLINNVCYNDNLLWFLGIICWF